MFRIWDSTGATLNNLVKRFSAYFPAKNLVDSDNNLISLLDLMVKVAVQFVVVFFIFVSSHLRVWWVKHLNSQYIKKLLFALGPAFN